MQRVVEQLNLLSPVVNEYQLSCWVTIINFDSSILAALAYIDYRRAYGSSRSAWSKGRRPPGAVLHSSNEPGEFSQWLCHDGSTIYIILLIITISRPQLYDCSPISSVFTVRRSLHGICYSNSVRPSVRPSVCLSHLWTVSTWFDLRSWFLHHRVAPSF